MVTAKKLENVERKRRFTSVNIKFIVSYAYIVFEKLLFLFMKLL